MDNEAFLALTNARTQHNHADSPFLRLPADVRARIYELTCPRVKINVRNYNENELRWNSRGRHSYFSTWPLLRVCREIRSEALAVIRAKCSLNFTYNGLRSDNARLINYETRKAVKVIFINQSDMEDFYNHIVKHIKLRHLDWDAATFYSLKGMFPALEEIRTTWELERDQTDGTTILTDMVREVFGKKDIILHAPLPSKWKKKEQREHRRRAQEGQEE
jgi:hypothetical protein